MRLSEVPYLVFMLGLGVVFGVVFLNILTSLQADQTTNSAAYNATREGITGIGNIFKQYGLVGTISGFAIVLGIVILLWRLFGAPGGPMG